MAGVSAGVCYLVVGTFGGALIAVFGALPAALVAAVAGVALLSAFGGALASAIENVTYREAAVVCFATTASGVTLLGIGAPFWGLVAGILAYAIAAFMRRG